MTLRLPKALSLRLDKHVLRAKRTATKYSKNDAIIAAVQQLVDQSEGGPSSSTESPK